MEGAMTPRQHDYTTTFPEHAHRTAAEYMARLTGVDTHLRGEAPGPALPAALAFDDELEQDLYDVDRLGWQ
jgi:hypothetical protein